MNKYILYYKKDGHREYFGDAFEAEDDEAAANIVDSVKHEGHKVYWDRYYEIQECDEHGNIIRTWNTAEERLLNSEKREKTHWFGKRLYLWLYRKWYGLNLIDRIKYGFERMFNGYDRRTYWNIDYSMADLLRFAVPKLIENSNGYPDSYAKKARKLLRGMTDDESANSFNTERDCTEEESAVADALYKSDLEKLLLNINLVQYYDNMGEVPNCKYGKINKSKYPIPYLRNSETIDSDKLFELKEKSLDWIFSFLRNNINNLWD